MDAGRARKLEDRIAKIVAEMLERRVKDPRLGFVTVTDARLTNDLREATVYYTVYGSAEEQESTAAALKSATGLIRSEVGHQTGLKHTPSLAFIRDTLPEGARNMEELVAQARAADQALAEAREGAEPAGDPDPYRVPRSRDDDDSDADNRDADDRDADNRGAYDDDAYDDDADESDDALAEADPDGERGPGDRWNGDLRDGDLRNGDPRDGDLRNGDPRDGDPRDGVLGRSYPVAPGDYGEIDDRGGAAARRRR